MAERVGFEPTVPVRVHSISSAARSATLAPLLKSIEYNNCGSLRSTGKY